ncbi:MAG: DUF4272 domain-containing protein [Pirellulaceae bacterium]
MNTADWARAHDISIEEIPPAITDFDKAYARSAADIAKRCLILQGIVAVAYECDSEPILEWFESQGIMGDVSPQELAFLQAQSRSEREVMKMQWRQETEWALLWIISKVDSLGLPTQQCDSRRLVDEIIPALGETIGDFVSSAKLRTPGEILAEDDRTYNLWCYAKQAKRRNEPLPDDLDYGVLYERRYAFEWLDEFQEWDEVTCDS